MSDSKLRIAGMCHAHPPLGKSNSHYTMVMRLNELYREIRRGRGKGGGREGGREGGRGRRVCIHSSLWMADFERERGGGGERERERNSHNKILISV